MSVSSMLYLRETNRIVRQRDRLQISLLILIKTSGVLMISGGIEVN